MPRITFIGAGSTVFTKNLLVDILSYPEFKNVEIALTDIDQQRLSDTELVARQIADRLNAKPTILTTIDRRRALDGANYVVNMIQVGAYKPATVIDFEIPKTFGIQQTIGDTLGIGGIMRGLRTIPVLLEMCQDMEELCPDVLHLNYVNPMAINSWAMNQASPIQTIGICHSVQGTANELAHDIGIPIEEINYLCAGINHMAFYLKFERKGKDLYPLLHQVVKEDRVPDWNRVRYKVLSRLGYFVTESSEHFSEYVPWFIKRGRPDLIEKYNIPLDEYLYRCQLQIKAWDLARARLENPDMVIDERVLEELRAVPAMPTMLHYALDNLNIVDRLTPSNEFAAKIIHSMETGQPQVVYGNVLNNGLIENLPLDCTVEVPCIVDRNGIQPTRIGEIPTHLAALMQTNINVQRLTVKAALTRNREHIYQAAMLDPRTAAELDLDQIWALVDRLIEEHGEWLPTYR